MSPSRRWDSGLDRLVAVSFSIRSSDGSERYGSFYGETADEARLHARRWAKRTGNVVIEDDEDSRQDIRHELADRVLRDAA